MPPIVQKPLKVVITMTIEPKTAKPKHLQDFLTRRLKLAMRDAQFVSPAGSKLLDMKVDIAEDE